jgi:hypothetical protein
MGDVEVEQVVERDAMGGDGQAGCYSKSQRKHQQMIAVDFERATPEFHAQTCFVLHGLVDIEPGDEQRGEKDKAFGRRDEAEWLIDQIAEMGREMGERHPDEEEASQCVQLGLARQLGKFHRLF